MSDDDLDSMFEDTLAPLPERPESSPTALSPSLRRATSDDDLWATDGLRYVFIRQTCTSCGQCHTAPSGIYLHSTHCKSKAEHLQLVQASDASYASLPREIAYLDGLSPFCQDCLNVPK